MPELPRQVIRERSFERQLRALIEDAREADDFVERAEFILARDPKIGSQVTDGIWFLPMASIGGGTGRALLHIRRFDGHAARYREHLGV